MDNYIVINGNKIELSKETINNIEKQLNINKIKEISSLNISFQYKMIREIDWNKKEKILIKDKKNKRIYINQYFDSNCEFGDNCIFIKCKFSTGCEFGSYCKFSSNCEFGSCCKFSSNCEFGSSCEFNSYCKFGSGCIFVSGCKFSSDCKFDLGCEFNSNCEFGSGCEFDSSCEFGSNYIKHSFKQILKNKRNKNEI